MTAPTASSDLRGRDRRDPLRRILPLLEVRPGRVAAAIGLGTLALACAIGLAAVAAWLIARASQMPPVLTLSVAVVSVRAFGIGRGVLRYLERLASHDVALRGMAALRARVYAGLADAPGTPAVRRGDLLARLGADVDAVGDVVVRTVIPAGIAVVTGLGSVVLVGVLLPEAGAALAGCLVVAGVVVPWLAARAAASVEADGAAARGRVGALALELLEEAPQLRVAGRFRQRAAELHDADHELDRVNDAGARVSGLSAGLGALAQGLAVLAALALGLPAVAAGRLAPVELSVVVLTPLAVFEATAGLPAAAVQWHRSREAARRLLGLLDGGSGPSPRFGGLPAGAGIGPQGRRATTAGGVPGPTTGGRVPGPAADGGSPGPAADGGSLGPAAGGGSLRPAPAGPPGDSGEWVGEARPVVRAVIDPRPGTVTVVTGASGSGKTTLLMQVAGLLPGLGSGPAPGTLFVAEDAHVFGTTVLENLRVARGDVTQEETREALGTVGLGPWLDTLPDGLGTMLGPDAANVSGGERRRLLVARALLARAEVLLVDEPAEHLDPEAADDLVRVLARHARATGSAVVLATHRTPPDGVADTTIQL
ncbi:amino acid ABC transporter ATP-binding/permease protein [Myceligenerans crystallogenes]|uniref:Thiol reductant ABC exporter subunit CydC n=1 Tax=Myceligenerans crystallogenes TaxID=316335 RepID=A0ABP4ZX72_9MICO